MRKQPLQGKTPTLKIVDTFLTFYLINIFDQLNTNSQYLDKSDIDISLDYDNNNFEPSRSDGYIRLYFKFGFMRMDIFDM